MPTLTCIPFRPTTLPVVLLIMSEHYRHQPRSAFSGKPTPLSGTPDEKNVPRSTGDPSARGISSWVYAGKQLADHACLLACPTVAFGNESITVPGPEAWREGGVGSPRLLADADAETAAGKSRKRKSGAFEEEGLASTTTTRLGRRKVGGEGAGVLEGAVLLVRIWVLMWRKC